MWQKNICREKGLPGFGEWWNRQRKHLKHLIKFTDKSWFKTVKWIFLPLGSHHTISICCSGFTLPQNFNINLNTTTFQRLHLTVLNLDSKFELKSVPLRQITQKSKSKFPERQTHLFPLWRQKPLNMAHWQKHFLKTAHKWKSLITAHSR